MRYFDEFDLLLQAVYFIHNSHCILRVYIRSVKLLSYRFDSKFIYAATPLNNMSHLSLKSCDIVDNSYSKLQQQKNTLYSFVKLN